MINLLDADIDIDRARDEHVKYFTCYVRNRLNRTDCILDASKNCTNCKKIPSKTILYSTNPIYNSIEFFLTDDRINEILSGTPHDLTKVQADFVELLKKHFKTKDINEFWHSSKKKKQNSFSEIVSFIKEITSFFNYKQFTSLTENDIYSAYKLAENLSVRSCVYCNRVYTVTRISKGKEKVMRPQFDHWFPKSKFPLLAVSFYNLIPCCTHCNSSIKGDVVLSLNDHIHPYVKESTFDSIKFDYYYSSKIDEYRVFIKKETGASGKALKTLKKLKIDEMYNAHHYELADLIKIREAYSDTYIHEIIKLFPDTGFSKEEVYRLLFGTEIEEKDFCKRPLSKFKYDILNKLGII